MLMKRYVAISLLLHIFLLGLYAQPHVTEQETDALTRYARNIINFNREYPQEKVYLHMDNRSYYIGDTIWFKAYVMNATTLHPTQLSGVLYVELLNEKGVEMEHKKLRMENGMCHGEFVLKDDYRTGYYEIRAYTRYMLNWGNDRSIESFVGEIGTELGGPSFVELYSSTDIRALPEFAEYSSISSSEFWRLDEAERLKMRSQVVPDPNLYIFSRVFPVYMCPETPGAYKKEMDFYPLHTQLAFPAETNLDLRADNLKLSFYPEGGVLVENTTSIVAFEATDQWGRKREVEGCITDGDSIVNTFKSMSRGRGVFPFYPQSGKEYHAYVVYKNKEYRFKLPQADTIGYVLRLTPPSVGGDMSFQVLCPPNAKKESLAWALQCRGALTDYDTLSGGRNRSFVVPKERLRTGVNQLTLFDEEGRILADRLFFVCPAQEPPILTTSPLPDSVKPYEKVDIDFQLQNKDGWPIQGLFSLSVTDADDLEHDTYDAGDIRSELLLSSDIKGFVEDVDSYFHHSTERAMVADIDMLMRIQGWRHHAWNREWRRYNWSMMAGVQPFEYKYHPEKGLGIDGYIISEEITRKGNLMSPHTYDRIPDLRMKATLNVHGSIIEKSGYADSSASYSIPFDNSFYGEIPMTITLEDALNNNQRKQQNRLKGSQIVINRAFSPRPLPYTYYQYKRPSESHQLDTIVNSNNNSAYLKLDEVAVKKRFKQQSEIFYDRPELIIDYTKEWNFIIDRGTPWANGQRRVSTKHNSEYRMNFPSLTYSLQRLGATSYATVKEDSIYARYRGNRKFYHSYIMPKTIKVYSNLLGRERHAMRDGQTDGRISYYLDIERYKPSESPKHPPFLSKNGVRHTFYEGYSYTCEFYSPDYSECALPDTADYRRTLYWNPDVWTDHQGRASVSFYNNKNTRHLHIRAEGFTRYGEFIVYDSNRQ